MTRLDPLLSFPPAIRAAHARWLSHRDLSALDTVVIAIVAFHQHGGVPFDASAELPDSTRLIEDLGYDSLIMAEVVFFIEDLFQVTLSDRDLKGVYTIADLRAHLRAKMAP